MLAERTDYLSAGVHIGMKSCTKYIRRFVYKIRDDGLAVFNLRKVDARIAVAAHFISGFKNVLVVSRKNSAAQAIEKFAEITGAKVIAGRFSPGTLTNPSYRDFFEPDVLITVDPLVDENAVKEAKKKRIPVVAICDTFNEASDIDFMIPANNNGKKSLAMIFMLLSREILKKRGDIKEDSEFKYKLEDFGADYQPPRTEERQAEAVEKKPEKATAAEKPAAEKKVKAKAPQEAKEGKQEAKKVSAPEKPAKAEKPQAAKKEVKPAAEKKAKAPAAKKAKKKAKAPQE
ncbi:MAG: 30S ribosomal protein S2, partial [Candidatus Aenigmatarchaeota archaeon]